MPASSFDASPVRRAVLPVGGRGTRMYPATAAVPKELLPVGTRPILEFALDVTTPWKQPEPRQPAVTPVVP